MSSDAVPSAVSCRGRRIPDRWTVASEGDCESAGAVGPSGSGQAGSRHRYRCGLRHGGSPGVAVVRERTSLVRARKARAGTAEEIHPARVGRASATWAARDRTAAAISTAIG